MVSMMGMSRKLNEKNGCVLIFYLVVCVIYTQLKIKVIKSKAHNSNKPQSALWIM